MHAFMHVYANDASQNIYQNAPLLFINHKRIVTKHVIFLHTIIIAVVLIIDFVQNRSYVLKM